MPFSKVLQAELKQLISESRTDAFIGKFEHIRTTDPNAALQYLQGYQDQNCGLLEWAAMKKKSADIIEYLISIETNIDRVDLKNRTALFMAVDRGHVDNARLLILHGANPDIHDWEGTTLLHLTAEPQDHDNNTKLFKLLCTTGADVTARNKHGQTPLHIAAQHNIEAIHAIMTLRKGVLDINVRDKEGDTPLHHAARSETGYNCTYLLMLGADSTLLNKDKKTPAEEAKRWQERGKDWKAIIAFDSDKRHDPEAFYQQVIASIKKEDLLLYSSTALSETTNEVQKALAIINHNSPLAKKVTETIDSFKQREKEIRENTDKDKALSLAKQMAGMESILFDFMVDIINEVKKNKAEIEVHKEQLIKVSGAIHSLTEALIDKSKGAKANEEEIRGLQKKVSAIDLKIHSLASNEDIELIIEEVTALADKTDFNEGTIDSLEEKVNKLLQKHEQSPGHILQQASLSSSRAIINDMSSNNSSNSSSSSSTFSKTKIQYSTDWYDFIAIKDGLQKVGVNIKHLLEPVNALSQLHVRFANFSEPNVTYMIPLSINALDGAFTATNHWVGLRAITNASRNIISLEYIDPMGKAINWEIDKKITELMGIKAHNVTFGKGVQFVYNDNVTEASKLEENIPMLVYLFQQLENGTTNIHALNEQESKLLGQTLRQQQRWDNNSSTNAMYINDIEYYNPILNHPKILKVFGRLYGKQNLNKLIDFGAQFTRPGDSSDLEAVLVSEDALDNLVTLLGLSLQQQVELET